MSEKNICQNPKCCDYHTKDRWNKKIERYQSRKAYFRKPYIFFCTYLDARKWKGKNI